IFLDAVTSPPQQEAFADPLLARTGDMLSRDLRVAGELGSGATSRVLAVERDGRKYALKVSLDSEQDARLKAEAEVLRKLAQAPVATLQDELELQGRTCLLLTLAGSTTLQRFLAAEGSASADLAARYGKDLLDALEELEALGITHRDIKPANIGVGSLGHGRKRLILFDFSLAGSSATSVGIGTAVYKDPYLAERGAWDAAADRWSAAVTLHELLTGIRPHYETPKYVDDHGHEVPADLDAAPTDKHATLKLAAERFDSQLRDALTAFFNTAFAPAIEQRFTDAAQMRRRWEACFDLEAQIHSQPHAAEEPTPSQPAANKLTPNEQLSDNEIAKISTDAAIASLPLTGRAKNALDRMGLLTGRDLLTLPENRLSVARGVGRMVAKEIVEFVNRWRALRPMSAAAGPVYFPSYRGEDILLTHSELSGRAVQALSDAGLRSLAQVADAPKSQVEVLLQKAMVEPSKLEELLTKAHRAKQDQFNSVEGVLSAFIPKQKKRAESLELLFGLRDPFIGRLDMTISQVARHRGSTRPNEYIQLSKCREQWEAIEALGNEPRPLDLLKSLVRALVVQAGGAIRADRFAERVLAELPHDRRADPQLTRAKAAAWARIVCEAEGQEEAGMRWVRLRSGRSPNNAANLPWVCQSDLLAEQVTALGKLADELAERPILASSTEAQRLATALVQGSSLERLPPDRLLALATDASQTAALSARLEIYPRGMDAARALELTAASLPVQLGAGAVQAHVRARYPEASPLPDAPTLDALMTPYGYKVFGSIYQRPQAEHQTASTQNTANSFHTQLDEVPDVFDSGDAANVDAEGTELDAPPTQASTATKTRKAGTSSPTLRAVRPEDARREAFVERLRQTLERDAYRVLGVHITRAAEATLALSRYLGVKPVLLDQLLVERMVQKKVPLHVIQGADREGPSGAAWPNLLRLAEAAAKELAAELLPNKQPLLLAQPGLLARYQLKDFLLRVAEASKQDDARAILLLVPRRDQGGMPVINNQLAIPGVLPTHTFWVSREWLDHQAADAAE
ncbi:MAG: DNA-directed RNA polymerase subunit alpha C-terminal domain-containing protein, partial [Polyangiaceae bacterium]